MIQQLVHIERRQTAHQQVVVDTPYPITFTHEAGMESAMQGEFIARDAFLSIQDSLPAHER